MVRAAELPGRPDLTPILEDAKRLNVAAVCFRYNTPDGELMAGWDEDRPDELVLGGPNIACIWQADEDGGTFR